MSATEPLPPARASLPMDDAVGRVALRKAGWRLLPLIGLGYGISYMDRINISFAALQMNRDLHFSATVYGLGGGLFFLSYGAVRRPSNLFLCVLRRAAVDRAHHAHLGRHRVRDDVREDAARLLRHAFSAGLRGSGILSLA